MGKKFTKQYPGWDGPPTEYDIRTKKEVAADKAKHSRPAGPQWDANGVYITPKPEKRPTKSERAQARKNPAPPPKTNRNLGSQFVSLGKDGRDSSGRSTAYDMGNGFNNYGSGMHAGPHFH